MCSASVTMTIYPGSIRFLYPETQALDSAHLANPLILLRSTAPEPADGSNSPKPSQPAAGRSYCKVLKKLEFWTSIEPEKRNVEIYC